MGPCWAALEKNWPTSDGGIEPIEHQPKGSNATSHSGPFIPDSKSRRLSGRIRKDLETKLNL